MQIFRQSSCDLVRRFAVGILLVFATAVTSHSQSTNIESPTPVISNEVRGMIEARDIGDSRLTRHFYLLVGTPGDIVVSVESSNLNGDVDLFTAGSLRPLTKLNIFAGLSTTSTSKSVFLRQRETLILRVEARSANDEPGSYRIRFSGGFEPVAGNTSTSENMDPAVSVARNNNQKVRRVNSAGARINEPLPEIVAETNPTEIVPPANVASENAENETPSPVKTESVKPKTVRPVRPTKATPPARTTRKRTTTTAKKKVAEPVATTSPTPAPLPKPAEPIINPRLIIETRDGVRVERYMSEVRRVTVERGLLIVITIDGKIERRPMASVLRVAIEP